MKNSKTTKWAALLLTFSDMVAQKNIKNND
jgi:hypothetical protein